MAILFWVGGTANWDGTAGLKWSLISGGVGGHAVPGAGDIPTFDGNSGAVTVTKTTNTAHAGLNMAGFTGTFAGAGNIGGMGSLTMGAGMVNNWTGSLTFTAAATITSNGIALKSALILSTAAITVQLADDCHTTSTLTLTNGSWVTNGHALTLDLGMTLTSALARTFNWTGSLVTIGGGLGSLGLTLTTTTNLTLTFDATSRIKFLMAGNAMSFGTASKTWSDAEIAGTGAGTLTLGGGTLARLFISNTGNCTVSWAGPLAITKLDCTGFTGTLSSVGTQPCTLSGDLIYGAGMTASWTGTLTINANCTITSNSVVPTCPYVVNGAGITVQCADDFHTTKGLTLTQGTFKTNGHAIGILALTYGGGSTQTLDWTGSVITFSGVAGGGIFLTGNNPAGVTLTFDATSSLKFLMSGNNLSTGMRNLTWSNIEVAGTGAGTLTLGQGGGNLPTYGNILVNNSGGCTLTWNDSQHCKDLTFLHGTFTGTFNGNQAIFMTGSLTLAGGMTNSYTGVINMNGTVATQNITTNGKALKSNVTINTTGGGTVKLIDGFTSNNTFSLTVGKLNTNGQPVDNKGLIPGANVFLDVSGTTWTLTSTVHITWQVLASTTFTTDANTKFLLNADAADTGFHMAGNTFPYIEINRTAPVGIPTLEDGGRIKKLVFGVLPLRCDFTGVPFGSIPYEIDEMDAPGTLANPIDLRANGAPAIFTSPNNYQSKIKNVALTGIHFGGGGFWYVGKTSIDNGGNARVRFFDCMQGRPQAA